MKILITGGSGLVGSALKKITKDFKYEFIFLSSKDCDLTSYQQTYDCFQIHKPDYVIHCAANVGGLFKNMSQKVQMFEDNTLITINVFKCCHQFNVKKVINILSTCIFPDKIQYPITEEQLHNGPPHDSNNAYAFAKRNGDILAQAYNEQYNMNIISVIPTNIYGMYDNFSLKDGHVIPALIHKCYLAKEKDEDFVICGSGKPLRQFIYNIDLAKIIIYLLIEYQEKKNMIVCPNDEISIGEVGTYIAECFNYTHKLTFDKTLSDGQYKKTCSNNRLMQLLPGFKFTSFEDGISTTINWFKNNYENVRKKE
jgi:GDP-L-fucose synthase